MCQITTPILAACQIWPTIHHRNIKIISLSLLRIKIGCPPNKILQLLGNPKQRSRNNNKLAVTITASRALTRIKKKRCRHANWLHPRGSYLRCKRDFNCLAQINQVVAKITRYIVGRRSDTHVTKNVSANLKSRKESKSNSRCIINQSSNTIQGSLTKIGGVEIQPRSEVFDTGWRSSNIDNENFSFARLL